MAMGESQMTRYVVAETALYGELVKKAKVEGEVEF
jgi:hypothetical protein